MLYSSGLARKERLVDLMSAMRKLYSQRQFSCMIQ